MNKNSTIRLMTFLGWCTHALTASTSVIGLLTIHYISLNKPIAALSMMLVAVLIDAIDGTLARIVMAKEYASKIDGTLLDNLVDFLNYVITPCAFLLYGFVPLSNNSLWLVISAICFSSSYQFSQVDAKTKDHFFKGFPCYWNIAVFYLFISNCAPLASSIILLSLCVLVFVPIKYVYPSRLTYLSNSPLLKKIMLIGIILYTLSTIFLLATYPKLHLGLVCYSVIFILFYMFMSLYRTLYPLNLSKVP